MPAEEIVNRMLKNGLGSLREKQAVAVRAGVVAALEGGLPLNIVAVLRSPRQESKTGTA
ncbi:MAG: hypothetical protein LBQ62_01870 [Candidatus Accumulibacter sp.]|jgi:hypothetical protein|nr:hypothetical protein [Accumulibacter sp.]